MTFLIETPPCVDEKLRGFPPAVVEAYVAFKERGDLNRLDEVVLGMLEYFLATPPPRPLIELPAETQLAADLGCDSLTMVDMLFTAEGLFDIKLADDELARVTTVGDLVRHIRHHLTYRPAPSA